MGAQGPSSAQPLLKPVDQPSGGPGPGWPVCHCLSSETSGSTWQNLIRGLRPERVYAKVMGLPGRRFGPCPPPPPLSLGWQEGFGCPTRPPGQPTDQEEHRVSGPGWTPAWRGVGGWGVSSLGLGDERHEGCQPHPILENLPPCPLQPLRIPDQDSLPVGSLQKCGCPPGPGLTLRPPPTPQAALLQWDGTPESSRPTPVARAGRHPGDRGCGRRRGPLHREAGPDTAGGRCQGRSVRKAPQARSTRERGVWAPGLRVGPVLPSPPLPSERGPAAPRAWRGRCPSPALC